MIQLTKEEKDELFLLLTVEIGGEDDKKDRTRADFLEALRDKLK